MPGLVLLPLVWVPALGQDSVRMRVQEPVRELVPSVAQIWVQLQQQVRRL